MTEKYTQAVDTVKQHYLVAKEQHALEVEAAASQLQVRAPDSRH